MTEPAFESHREHIESMVASAIAAADPERALYRHWPRELDQRERVHLVAIGKASVGMAIGAVDRLGPLLARGIVTCVPSFEDRARAIDPRLEVLACDHPLASARNLRAAEHVRDFASSLTEHDTLLVLISGGGSAHLTLPAGDLTLDDIRDVTRSLLDSGARIGEINTVRAACEVLKGGGLAGIARPARVVAVAVSDVMGNDVRAIASGPTVAWGGADEALRVLQRYDLRVKHSKISAFLSKGGRDVPSATAIPRIIASNADAVRGAARRADELGFVVTTDAFDVSNDAVSVGQRVAKILERAKDDAPRCWVAGGEPTVRVEGNGVGGRAQELVLAAAGELIGEQRRAVAAFGTDGIDGPTDAAGAIATGETCEGRDWRDALDRHDSSTFFGEAGGLLVTGPTGTNVNDVLIALSYDR